MLQRFANSERFWGAEQREGSWNYSSWAMHLGIHMVQRKSSFMEIIALQLDVRSWPLDGQLGVSLPTNITRGMDEKQ